MKVDKTTVNLINKSEILNLIRKNRGIYKAELARLSGLSIPSVMTIVDDFIQRGIVREIGKGKSSGGKPPKMLEFINNCYYAIGVDVGTTNITTIIMDFAANIISRCCVPTKITEAPEVIIEQIILSINEVIDKSDANIDQLLGIGLGVPGLLDVSQGNVRFSPDFGWEDVSLVSVISEQFDLPILINNVTRTMAVGEYWFGYATDIQDFLYINLGFGIGSAIVIDGELYEGNSDTAGEIGHITMIKDGPHCSCGNYGCLEALASANAIKLRADELISLGEATILTNKGHNITTKDVFDAAKIGDTMSLEIINTATEYLGIALASIANMLDPKIIVLSGGMSLAGEILLQNVKRVFNRHKMRYAAEGSDIKISLLGSDAAAIGAATLILKKFIENSGSFSF